MKLASSPSPQKPPATYMRVNDFGPHTDSIFRGRLIREYIRYIHLTTRKPQFRFGLGVVKNAVFVGFISETV